MVDVLNYRFRYRAWLDDARTAEKSGEFTWSTTKDSKSDNEINEERRLAAVQFLKREGIKEDKVIYSTWTEE